jgi:hypothetical protein
VDNAVEMNIVTSTGEYLTVNSHQHPDLFWALRGGGGGTYGVLTSVTYQTHPSFPLTAVFVGSNSSNTNTMRKLFREFVRIHPALSDAGFGGYGSMINNNLNWFVISNGTETTTNRTLNSFFEYAQNLTSEGLNLLVNVTTYDSFFGFYEDLFAPGPDIEGGLVEIGSRLIPRKSFETDFKRLADTLFDLNGGVNWKYVCQSLHRVSAHLSSQSVS